MTERQRETMHLRSEGEPHDGREELGGGSGQPRTEEVEVIGCVVAVDVQRKTLQLQTDQGEKVLVPFTEKQELDVIAALKEREVAQLLVNGQGRFSPDGNLQEMQDVTVMWTVAKKNREVDPNAPSIEDEIAEIFSDVPEEAWGDMPTDFSHRHDLYLYGYDKHEK